MTRLSYFAGLAAVAACVAGAFAEFKPLFDGKSLKGWHIQGQGAWAVKDGSLVGTHDAAGKLFGHLVSDSSYGDFTFRYRWKLVKGNSGLYYHSAEGGEAGMIGPQVEMDGAYPGGIYTTNTNPWGWVAQPKPEDVKTWWKPNDWNLVTVTTVGAKVTITYNGIKTAETSDARLPKAGSFGFQVHANTDCEIWVDDVEVEVPAVVTLQLPKASRSAGAGDAGARDFLGRMIGYRTISRSGSALPTVGLSR